MEARLRDALAKARSFAGKHGGKLGALDGPGLVAAMQELAAIHDLVGRAGAYAALRFSTNTAEPENGALLQLVQERETEIETTLLFFELEWAALDDEAAERLLAADGSTSAPITCAGAPLPRSPALRTGGAHPG